jgi:uncharacterized protein
VAALRALCYVHAATTRREKGFLVKLLVDRIEETPAEVLFELTPDWIAQHLGDPGAPQAKPEGEGRIALTACRSGSELFLEGRVEGAVKLACGRCLGRYRQPVREAFRLVLEPAGERVPADPEGAQALAEDGLFLSDELESGWFRGTEIRLDRLVRELLSLALPVQPLCREECRGLCPRCGVDRNTVSCNCSEERPASPFRALESLKASLEADAEGDKR